MSLFSIRKRADVEAAGTVALAALTRPTFSSGWGVGISRLTPAEFPVPPIDVWSREAAMSVPTVSRARDLLCSAVGALPLTLWNVNFNDTGPPIEQQIPPAAWMARPDPNRTRQFLLAWTVDDLLFLARAYWRITSRYADSYPATFEWLPAADVNIDHSGKVSYLGQTIDGNDIIEFLSPLDGILYTGWRSIQTALNLEGAANRFSTAEIPAGWLQQRENSEPLDSTELAEMASEWQAARASRTTAALNPFLEWHESTMDPDRLELTASRGYQSLELARLANIPPYLVGAPAGTGMTYQNTAQAKADLVDFGIAPFTGCIEQTLSGPNVTPRGQFVRLDLNAWLRNPFVPNASAPSPNDAQIAFNPDTPPAPSNGPGRPRQSDGQTGAV